jgi:small-conductance mechanosensitive channel
MHTELLAAIRSEYDHNISQQVYISPKAWEMVKNARSQIVKVINTAAEQTDPAAPAIELSKKIIEGIGEFPKSPTQSAIDFVKNEIQAMF